MYRMGKYQDSINEWVRAANYLSVAQIFLQDNFLLERPLDFKDIKPRLLGHWGTCPGINLAYAYLTAWMKAYDLEDVLFILGPGHGFPALQANLFLEGSLGKVHAEAMQNLSGIEYMCKNFSWPGGFPSHASPMSPGVILEGGELGYSVGTAYGAVLDNPELIVPVLIGDGEAETASLLASLNLNKLVSPKSNGVVLPILHLNGYKITGPTFYGRMSDKELVDMFAGFGFETILVGNGEEADFDEQMAAALERSYEIIRKIKASDEDGFFRTPFIIMRTPKGMTGPEELNGEKITGNYLSHQVVLTKAKTDEKQLRMLEEWLKSYRFGELYNKEKGFSEFVKELALKTPMGMNKHVVSKENPAKSLATTRFEGPDEVTAGELWEDSAMDSIGLMLRDTLAANETERNFRIFSPDETVSNDIEEVYEATTRQWLRPLKNWDKDMSPGGRVTEILSENTLQSMMSGYILTGRHGVLCSYEAFMPVVTSQVNQYAKFLEQSKDVEWRGRLPAFNYILTSVGWRQDHNGFSHQNPGFINDMLLRPSNLANVLLPVDSIAAGAAMEFCLKIKNKINVLTVGKTDEPRWIDANHARYQLTAGGASIFGFASDDNPQLVIASAGDYVTKEALAGWQIIKKELPDLRIRFVNIAALSYGAIGTTENKLGHGMFEELFTDHSYIIANFHGYVNTLKVIMSNYTDLRRVEVHGYEERGSTTTSFDMQVLSETDRWHVAMSGFRQALALGVINGDKLAELLQKYEGKLAEHAEYIRLYGIDLPEIKDWKW